MEASDIFAFYASHGPMTDPGEASALIDPLPMMWPPLAASSRDWAFMTLSRAISMALSRRRIAWPRSICGRSLSVSRGSWSSTTSLCRSRGSRSVARFSAAIRFALMLVTLLRAKGVPARSRCGFAAYFNPPNFEDHWVCEYWDAQERRWRLADPQIDDVWRGRLNIGFDTLDLPRSVSF